MVLPRSLKIGIAIVVAGALVLVLLPFFALGDGWWQNDDPNEDE